ncbi:hypothetical protein CEXT_720761 [Caerostris extrusa]|uniref:Secreted protein n=1 Tax=Caerostris extrusa TaxID=172846 RepID=A0AAV4PR92_CAEEX|nr:hypothetical protein CEXT_720761 [Caerostris extrusa]
MEFLWRATRTFCFYFASPPSLFCRFGSTTRLCPFAIVMQMVLAAVSSGLVHRGGKLGDSRLAREILRPASIETAVVFLFSC